MGNSSVNRKVVTFGEVLMRLSPPENRKISQAHQLNYYFGGAEMNVAASLACFGEEATHVTNVSSDFVGEAAISFMRKSGIDVSAVKKVDHPLGLYFMEVGSEMRASRIAYNRLHSSFANINPEEVNWDEILDQAAHFHWTGISPAVSESAYLALKNGLQIAKNRGLTITADPAYRSNLWRYGRNGHEVLKEMVGLSTIFIGGVNEINEILNTNFDFSKNDFIAASKALMKECPSISGIFDKVRTGISASRQQIFARAWSDSQYFETREYEITNVVDRVGTGDAFAAGLIYGLIHYKQERALNFANAACALKHSVLGDTNLVSVEEIEEVMAGNTTGRIKR